MTVRILFDAVLPESLAEESPAGVQLIRWEDGYVDDATLVRTAALRGYRALLLYERDSLEQPDVQSIAAEVGVALVAVDASDPIEAKVRILRNFRRLRKMLTEHNCLLVLASTVRVYPS